MIPTRLIVLSFAAILTLFSSANASPQMAAYAVPDNNGHWTSQFSVQPMGNSPSHRHKRFARAKKPHLDANGNYSERIVGHPSGCPGTQFCGCGASVRIFGHPVRDLYLAANWRKFPPASCAAGNAAWRYGHVFVIEQCNGDGTVLAYDANSGGHQTRIHTVSLRGYHVVNPGSNAMTEASVEEVSVKIKHHRRHHRRVHYARKTQSASAY